MAAALLDCDDDGTLPGGPQSASVLRIELAKKGAEIEYLQGALAEATAAQGLAEGVPEMLGDAAEVKSELQLVKQELSELRGNAARCDSNARCKRKLQVLALSFRVMCSA